MNDLPIKFVIVTEGGTSGSNEQTLFATGILAIGAEATFGHDLLNFQLEAGITPHNTSEFIVTTNECFQSQMDPECERETVSEKKRLIFPFQILLSWQPGFANSRLHVGPTAGGLWLQDTTRFTYGLAGDIGITKPTAKRGSVLSLSAQFLHSLDYSSVTGGLTFRIPIHTFEMPVISQVISDEELVEPERQAEQDHEALPEITVQSTPAAEPSPIASALPQEEPSTSDMPTELVDADSPPVEAEQLTATATEIPDPVKVALAEPDWEAVGGRPPGSSGSGELSDRLTGGIGGLIGARGQQVGSGGLGSPGSGLGGGGTAGGLGGLSTSSGRQKMAPSTLPQFSYDPSRYRGAAPKVSSREPPIDPLTDEGSAILMSRIHTTFLGNHVEEKEGGRIQELWSQNIVSRNPSAHCDITVQLSVTADGRPDKIHIQLDHISGVLETDTALLEVFEQNVGDLIFRELRFPPLTTPIEEDNQLFFQYTLVGQE